MRPLSNRAHSQASPASVRQWAKSARCSAGTPKLSAASVSYEWSGPPALGVPVAKPPRTASGVTQAGSPATGVREPTVSRPAAIPARTARQRCPRTSARRRVSASSRGSAVVKALAGWAAAQDGAGVRGCCSALSSISRRGRFRPCALRISSPVLCY